MIKCREHDVEFEGTAVQLTTDFSMVVLGLIDTLQKNTPIDIDDIILLVEKSFKLGVKSYFDFKDGGINEE